MAIDLVLLTTLIVSIGDLFVNLFGLCCSGRCKVHSCCVDIEHNEKNNLSESTIDTKIKEAIDEEHKANNI